MRPNREHIHAVFATRRDLLADGRFMALIHDIEAFNGGSPFTLCRYEGLGTGDVNFTGAVRQALTQQLWIPEDGMAEIAVSEPANGRYLTLELSLPVESGRVAQVGYWLDAGFFSHDEWPQTLAFLREVAQKLDAVTGYAHHGIDELLQDTTDPKQYRALSGQTPPETLDIRDNPGRARHWGPFLLTSRWLTWFGGEVLDLLGRERVLTAPCRVEQIHEGLAMLRLYDDPFAYESPENRALQASVRAHLGIDTAAEPGAAPSGPSQGRSAAVATSEVPRVNPPPPRRTEPNAGLTERALAIRLALPDPWADASPAALEPYTARARGAGGPILQLGCGTGDLTLTLARLGVPLVVVEPSTEALEHLRQRLATEPSDVREGVRLAGGLEDVTALAEHGAFAAAFVAHSGLARYRRDALRELLGSLRGALRQGGELVLTAFVPDPRLLVDVRAALPKPLGEAAPGQTRVLVQDTTEADPIAQRLRLVRRVEQLDPAGRVAETRLVELDLHYYWPHELGYLLELTGFHVTAPGLGSEPPATSSQEVVIVARRS